MSLITLKTEPDISVVKQQFAVLGKSIVKAERLAVSTATRQTGSEARKQLRAAGVTGQKVKRRVHDQMKDGTGRIWVGLSRWKAGYFTPLTPRDMSPEQQADLPGAYAQDFFFKGAFVARMDTGHLGIFKRRVGQKWHPTRGFYAGKKTRKGQPYQREKLAEQYISARALGIETTDKAAEMEHQREVSAIGELLRANRAAIKLDTHLETHAQTVLQREFIRQMERQL